jgi:hypothetical protein
VDGSATRRKLNPDSLVKGPYQPLGTGISLIWRGKSHRKFGLRRMDEPSGASREENVMVHYRP